MANRPSMRDGRRRRQRSLFTGLAAIAVIALGMILLLPRGPVGEPPQPEATVSPTDAADFERPASWGADRPAIHLTPHERWMNDPQRPFFLDGLWHYYYLYNADYPDGNGTEWYHATSTDLVHWVDQGVAIEKYTNGLGDIWTGTAVVDHENTAGFGEDAVIAIVTQQTDGVQRQSLFVSRDGGYHFEPYEGNPVMDNPGVADFRDPRVLWDEERERWTMLLAEHDKIGFYSSPDLKSWTYESGFATTDLGVLECPDLFPMALDGDPERVRWVLAAGANGTAEGMTTGTVYWIGDWDGTTFTPERAEHQWLDRGADYYASVTWDDPRLSSDERLSERYGIGWLNNWAYAGEVPGEQWRGGSDSVVRSIRLVTAEGGPQLQSRPLDALRDLEGKAETTDAALLGAGDSVALPEADSDAYRLALEIESVDDPRGEVRFRIPRGQHGEFATVGYDFATGRVFVARDADAVAHRMPEEYRVIRTAEVAPRDGRVRLDVIVDVGSIEVFANDGAASLSMISVGSPGTRGLAADAVGADIRLTAEVTPLRVAPVQRVPADD